MEGEFEDELHLKLPEKLCSLEQDLAAFKEEYFKMTREERIRYRQGVTNMPSWAVGQDITISIHIPPVNEQGNYRRAQISPKILNQAIETWDAGENFAPTLDSIFEDLLFGSESHR
jgi:hypothetical protein